MPRMAIMQRAPAAILMTVAPTPGSSSGSKVAGELASGQSWGPSISTCAIDGAATRFDISPRPSRPPLSCSYDQMQASKAVTVTGLRRALPACSAVGRRHWRAVDTSARIGSAHRLGSVNHALYERHAALDLQTWRQCEMGYDGRARIDSIRCSSSSSFSSSSSSSSSPSLRVLSWWSGNVLTERRQFAKGMQPGTAGLQNRSLAMASASQNDGAAAAAAVGSSVSQSDGGDQSASAEAAASVAAAERSESSTEVEEVDWQEVYERQGDVARLPPVEQARSLIAKAGSAVLVTKSVRFSDYPFGSKVKFAVDDNGFPLLAVSSLSPHTRDLTEHPQCAIMVSTDLNQLPAPTCTLMGDAAEVVDEADRAAVREAYLRKHPDAMWVDFGDFHFVRITPIRLRYTANVGNVAQGASVREFSREEYEAASPDAIALVETPIISHMNRDHAEATRAMAELALGIPVDAARMVAMDRLGFEAEVDAGGLRRVQVRIPFSRPAESRRDVKDIIVEMSRESMRAAGASHHRDTTTASPPTAAGTPST
ncbi:hypothetical protein CBR_g45943 [Chara braunii]|uniref:Uncharacterized protein n=1 Tax=Chara braunii TaxID=69332 RepID=A0A388LZP4_CHABU|nr:hypothetical protein CBR_g45943 [Chara braunii]|eukprot:GBG87787.1 hypothetical protein CBR_g45943 [Chara braunii]